MVFADVPNPLISISPASGPFSGGTLTSIMGANFTDTREILVRFTDSNSVVDVLGVFVNRELLTCVTPSFPGGPLPRTVNVTVALNGQQFQTNSLSFLYYGCYCSFLLMWF